MLNRVRFVVSALTLGLLMSACTGGDDDPPMATTAKLTPADADPEKGEVLFLQCRACHSLESGGANKVGPNLHGIFGRKAGLASGFSYSEAVTRSSIVWSDETLDQWLTRPSDFLPGNRMVFVGIRKPGDRANLIAYLRRETG